MTRRIKQNAWGNWKGYEGARRVEDFGTDEQAARRWVNEDNVEWLRRRCAMLEDHNAKLVAALRGIAQDDFPRNATAQVLVAKARTALKVEHEAWMKLP